MTTESNDAQAGTIDAKIRVGYGDRRYAWLLGALFCCAIYFLLGFSAAALFHRYGWDVRLFGPSILGILSLMAFAWCIHRRMSTVKRWDCAKCGRRLESNIPWVCGACLRENRHTSFLQNCEFCKAKPKALACYHCGHNTFFFAGVTDSRARAEKVPEALPGESDDQARQRRMKEIAEREHEKQKLELEIQLTRLRISLKQQADPVNERQHRIDRLWRQIEDAEIECKTIQQTTVKEKALLATIETDPDLDDHQQSQLKEIVSRKFEGIRLDLGGDIRV